MLIPCYNEELTIGAVVTAFRREIPHADIYVYDNNSTDQTGRAAQDAGAIVRRETQQGKGHVVRRMFADIEADIYVLIDGDGTYDVPSAPQMIAALIQGGLDMVNAARQPIADKAFPARPQVRQSALERRGRRNFRPNHIGHAVRVSGAVTPVRQIVSVAVDRL